MDGVAPIVLIEWVEALDAAHQSLVHEPESGGGADGRYDRPVP